MEIHISDIRLNGLNALFNSSEAKILDFFLNDYIVSKDTDVYSYFIKQINTGCGVNRATVNRCLNKFVKQGIILIHVSENENGYDRYYLNIKHPLVCLCMSMYLQIVGLNQLVAIKN